MLPLSRIALHQCEPDPNHDLPDAHPYLLLAKEQHDRTFSMNTGLTYTEEGNPNFKTSNNSGGKSSTNCCEIKQIRITSHRLLFCLSGSGTFNVISRGESPRNREQTKHANWFGLRLDRIRDVKLNGSGIFRNQRINFSYYSDDNSGVMNILIEVSKATGGKNEDVKKFCEKLMSMRLPINGSGLIWKKPEVIDISKAINNMQGGAQNSTRPQATVTAAIQQNQRHQMPMNQQGHQMMMNPQQVHHQQQQHASYMSQNPNPNYPMYHQNQNQMQNQLPYQMQVQPQQLQQPPMQTQPQPTGNIGGIAKIEEISRKRREADAFAADNGLKDIEALRKNAELLAALAKRAAGYGGSNSNGSDAAGGDDDLKSLLKEYGLYGATNAESDSSNGDNTLSPSRNGSDLDPLHEEIRSVCVRALQSRKIPIILSSDVFCLVNRLRGTDPLSPKELMSILEHIDRVGKRNNNGNNTKPTIALRHLSGGTIIQLKTALGSNSESDGASSFMSIEEQVESKILKLIDESEYKKISAAELSEHWGVSIALALLELKHLEMKNEGAGGTKSPICRDDSIEGLYWYRNLIF